MNLKNNVEGALTRAPPTNRLSGNGLRSQTLGSSAPAIPLNSAVEAVEKVLKA